MEGRAVSKQLLVVYHSRTGGTRQLVQSLQDGARDGGASTTLRLLPAHEAQVDDLLAADGYVFAAPENLAALSGEMKEFFDRCYYGALDRIQGRPCALLVCAGSDGSAALQQMQRITTGWRLQEVAEPLIACTYAQSPEEIAAPKRMARTALERCYALGSAMTLGLELGVF